MKEINKIALMAVGDDGWMGGIQYIINIVHALNEVAATRPLEVTIFKHSSQHFKGLEKFSRLKLHIRDINETLPPFSFTNRVQWFLQRKLSARKYPRFENYLMKEGFDYVYPTLLSNCNGRLNSGAWIADFQYHHFPDGAHTEVTRDAERVIGGIAHEARKVIFSSHYCEQDAHLLFPVTKGKTYTMPFTVFLDKDQLQQDNLQQVLEKYDLPQDYMMVSNLFAPTKNHETLFNAMGILLKQGRKLNLVCTGNIVDYRNHAYANDILQMLTRNGIRSQVFLLGLVPRTDQVALYRMARALVQPSVNEGWSTLVEEAKALGKNLLLADIEVHKEQYPGNPYFFSAMSASDLADKINLLYNNTTPGYPEIEREKRAFEDYQQQVIDFGNRFLEIAAS
jgi:glycosyltransferase involved in cell wall biosynthesis